MSRKRLLFTGGGGSASQSIHEQWRDRYDLYFADASPDSIPPSIPPERRLAIPFAADPAFLPEMRRICAEARIDLLAPGVDEELPPLAAQKGAPGWPKILLPPADFVALALDKRACAEALAAAGLEAPRTLPLRRGAELPFPLIAKPRSGRGSRGVMRLTRPEQIEAYLTLHGGDPDDYIAQELIPGVEYTVLVAGDDDGELRAVVPVLAYEKRGVTIRARTDPHPAVIDYARRLQQAFRPSGIYNLQCMLTPEGRVSPFEINPRISTTFVLAVAAGFDPTPLAFGEAEEKLFLPRTQWSLRRSWRSDVSPLQGDS